MAKTLVLINEKSGAVSALGVKDCIRAIQETSADGEFLVEVANGDPSKLIDQAATAIEIGEIENIYAIGGDGTMAALAGVLAGSDLKLAPLPGGTMNALSLDLGFDSDLLTAIRQLSSPQTNKIDVAFIGEMAFLNNVVFGAYTSVAESREHVRDVDGIIEKVGALGEVVAAVAHSEVNEYRIKMDTQSIQASTNTLMVSNNFYDGADLLRPSRSRLDSGKLGIYVAQSKSPVDFLSVLFDALSTGLTQSDLVDIHNSASCVVDSDDHALQATVDGEVMDLEGPMELRMRPKSLNVITPS